MELPPGFRFHPTDEELVTHYLSPKVLDSSFTTKVIGEVDLNKVEPWDLPWKVKMGEKEWYFFCVRDRKYPTGTRANRATDAGYWKATGKDKEVIRAKMVIGMKKTLVFYMGRAPKGEKTNWVLHEYRLEGKHSVHVLPKCAKNEWVICRAFKKKVHIPGLVRRANLQTTCLPRLMDLSSCNDQTRTSEGSDHVTCFSNSVKFSDEFCPSQGSHKYDSTPCTESLCPQDSVLVQEESMLQLLLETNGPSMNQNGVQEISQETGMNMDAGFAISNQGMVGFEQELPFVSSGQVHLDCLWDF